ncbi:MAG: hypothetical protein F4Y57_03130 [Acidobacteria bacterium]|nr:hypothetical protein [Acidobacteriota bacterium]
MTSGRLSPQALAGRPARGAARIWRRALFGPSVRAEVWQLLADVVEGSGADLGRMMEAVAEGYALQGRKTVAAVILEIRAGLGEGAVAERVRPYCGGAERIVFDGLGKQKAGKVLKSAARLLRSQLAMRKAVLGAVALPVLLTGGFVALLLFFGIELLPALGEIIAFETLPPFQGWVVRATLAFAADPFASCAWIAGGVAALLAAMRWWTGPGRTQADRLPPFSLMRLQTGAGFLFAVVEYGRSGQAVNTKLIERMAGVAGPYGRSRIGAIARCYTPGGGNLGEAAALAGQGFPAPELSAVLRTLWNQPGGFDAIGNVLERWLGRIEDSVKAKMAALNVALMALIAAAMVSLMSIALPIFDQINQATNL